MHRSQTFTKTINLNTDDVDYPTSVIVSLALIEILSSSIYFCFPLFFVQRCENGFYSKELGLWTIILFKAFSSIFDPLIKKFCYLFGDHKFKWKIGLAFSAVTATSGLITCSIVNSPKAFILIYGILGGLLTKLISHELLAVATRQYEISYRKYFSMYQISKNVSFCVMPFIALSFIYTLKSNDLFYFVVLLIIIPCSSFLKNVDGLKQSDRIKSFTTMNQNHPVQSSNQLSTVGIEGEGDVNVERTSDSSSDDEEADFSEEYELDSKSSRAFPADPNFIKQYYKEIGVNILPEIPENAEEEYESDDCGSVEDMDVNTKSEDQLVDIYFCNLSNPRLNIEECIIDESKKKEKRAFWEKRKFSKAFKSVWRSSRRFFKALINIRLYPLLLTKVVVGMISACFISLIPLIAKEGGTVKSSELNSQFIIMIIPYSSCLVMFFLNEKTNLTKWRIRAIFLFGLFLLATGVLSNINYNKLGKIIRYFFSVTSLKFNLMTSFLLFGLGYGLTNYTEKLFYRDYMSKIWYSIKPALEITTGICILIIYYLVFKFHIPFKFYAITGAAALIFIVIWWIIILIVNYVFNR